MTITSEQFLATESIDEFEPVSQPQFQKQIGQSALHEVVVHEVEDAFDTEQPVSWGEKYLDSMFGIGIVKEAGLDVQENSHLIAGTLMRINWDLKDEEKRVFYATAARMVFEGYSQSQVAGALEVKLNKVMNGLSELKRRTTMRAKDAPDSQTAFLKALQDEKEGVSYDECPMPIYAKKYLDFIFGSGTTESLDLKRKDIDIVVGAIERIDWEFDDKERKGVYTGALKLLLDGFGFAEIAKLYGVSENKMVSDLRQLQHRVSLRIRDKSGQDLLAEMMDQEENKASDEQNRIALKGMKFIDAIYGEKTVESLDLRLKDIDILVAALVESIYDSKEKKEFYSDILKRTFRGQVRGDVADALGIAPGKVDIEIGEIKRKLQVHAQQGTLLEMINKEEEKRLNEPLAVLPKRLQYPSLSKPVISPQYYENIDSLATDPIDEDDDDNFEMLRAEGLCQQVDQGINTGDYVLNSYEAKQVCGMCHLSKICLEYALVNKFDRGIWGGLSTRQRRALIQEQTEAAKEVA